ncbi:MAG: SET domain-containing protein, partial [Colwellia sp.]|nr:SET domain-containing protein [Colwellia sp.]
MQQTWLQTSYFSITENKYMLPISVNQTEYDYCECDQLSSVCLLFEHCKNRQCQFECTELNCNVSSDECENRRFQNKLWKAVKVQHTGNRGFGLYAQEDIKTDEFIMEYCGEVISSELSLLRIQTQYAQNSEFYIMQMSVGLIDATQYGSEARFANHSCNPNCVIMEWNIDERHVIGFFAQSDIRQG